MDGGLRFLFLFLTRLFGLYFSTPKETALFSLSLSLSHTHTHSSYFFSLSHFSRIDSLLWVFPFFFLPPSQKRISEKGIFASKEEKKTPIDWPNVMLISFTSFDRIRKGLETEVLQLHPCNLFAASLGRVTLNLAVDRCSCVKWNLCTYNV